MIRRTLFGVAFCFGFLAAELRAGTLSGRVTDAGGQPVVGARVVWFAYLPLERSLVEKTKDSEPTPLGETKTDAGGRFQVSPLKPPGEVSLRVFSEGLPSVEIEGPLDPSGESEELEIFVPAAEAVSGRVVDEAGKPMSGVRVRIGVSPFFAEGDGLPFDETKTAADGSFTLKAAPIGAVSLGAYLPGYAGASAPRTRSNASERIVLRRGGTVEGTVLDLSGKPVAGVVVMAGLASETDEAGSYKIVGVPEGLSSVTALWKDDFVARRDGVRIKKGEAARVDLKLARSASISGTVIDEKTRRPIVGARVVASEARVPWIMGRSLLNAITDARGRFHISRLLARDYTVAASRKDYLPSLIPGVVASISPEGSALFALRRAVMISGLVSDEEGKPVSGARVALVPGRGRMTMLEMRWPMAKTSTASGMDGTFRLRGIVPHPSVSIEASKTDYAPSRRDGISATGQDVKKITLTLSHGLKVRGRVVDEQSQPVSDTEVRLSRADGNESGGYSQPNDPAGGRPAIVTGKDGSFLARGLEAGEYLTRLSRSGFAKKTVMLEVKSEGVTEWPPIVLRGSAPITGVVRNSKGEPIAAARISAYQQGSDGQAPAVSDSEGRFRLDGFAEGATANLVVTAPGSGRLQTAVKAPASDVVLVLPATGTLRGRVEDADSKQPLESFSVRWGTSRSSSMRYSSSRDFRSTDGTFEVSDVVAGKLEVSGSAPGYPAGDVTAIDVEEGEIKEGILLSLRKGKSTTGRVLDPAHNGVANAIVSWREAGSPGPLMYGGGGMNIPNSTTTDADGGFRYDGLPSGKLLFSALHPDFMEATKSLDTASENSVELVLGVGGSIAGQVVGRDRRAPPSGVLVTLRELGGSLSGINSDEVRPDASGRFEFEHLKEGRYHVAARATAGQSPSRDVVLRSDQRVDDVLLEFAGGTLIRGRVTGLALGQLSAMRIYGSAKDFQSSAPVGDDGQFVLRDAPSGVLRISAAVPNGRSTMKTVEVPEGATEIPVEIVFEGSSRLSGRVLRGDKGVTNVYVYVNPDPPSSGSMRSSAQTDADGRYLLEGLTDGNYRLSVSAPGINKSRTVVISGDTSADLVLGGISVSGIVTDAASGEPIRDVIVQAQAATTATNPLGPIGGTDSRGYYALENLDAGNYHINARHRGYESKTQDVSVGDSPQELNFALSRGAALAVRVTDGLTGLPLQSLNALVMAPSGAIAFQGTVSLDSTGQGEVSSLTPGHYSLYLFSTGYASRRLPSVDVPSPMLGISMTPGGTLAVHAEAPIAGRILDAAGVPYRPYPWGDGRVSVRPPVAEWENFPSGSYQLVVESPDGNKSYAFTVMEGQRTTVTVK